MKRLHKIIKITCLQGGGRESLGLRGHMASPSQSAHCLTSLRLLPPPPRPPSHPLHFSLATAVVFHKGFTDSAQPRSADPDFKNKNPGDLQPGYSNMYEETENVFTSQMLTY